MLEKKKDDGIVTSNVAYMILYIYLLKKKKKDELSSIWFWVTWDHICLIASTRACWQGESRRQQKRREKEEKN